SCSMWASFRSSRRARASALILGERLFGAEKPQDGHAHRDAGLDLIEDRARGAVGDLGIDLDAAVDGAGVHDEAIGLGQGETSPVEAELSGVLAGARKERAAEALALDA